MLGDRFVDITQDAVHLSRWRGFMRVQKNQEDAANIPLDHLHSVIVHAHGVTYSNALLVEFMNRHITFIFCGTNHMPVGQLWSVDSNSLQAQRIDLQVQNTAKIKGRVWKKIVSCKVANQGRLLLGLGIAQGAGLLEMAKKVRAHDLENIEAQAARKYFKALFGNDFLRDRDQAGVNSMLNYGYIILRSMMARHIMAAGLLPVFSINHCSRHNVMRLVDDFMEPYRPVVDLLVYGFARADGEAHLLPIVKKRLSELVSYAASTPCGEAKLGVLMDGMVQSYIVSLNTGRAAIARPDLLFKEAKLVASGCKLS
jgi:CRISPR-associated protein Cas1